MLDSSESLPEIVRYNNKEETSTPEAWVNELTEALRAKVRAGLFPLNGNERVPFSYVLQKDGKGIKARLTYLINKRAPAPGPSPFHEMWKERPIPRESLERLDAATDHTDDDMEDPVGDEARLTQE